MEQDKKKQLTLKYKQVQRLTKEYNSYKKEEDKIKEKIKKEEESNVEEYYINKSKEFLTEAKQTKAAVRAKLRGYLDELISYFNEVYTPDFEENEEIKVTKEIINTGNLIFSENEDE